MKSELIDKFTLLITNAFGFVAALAWNEAIKKSITRFGFERFGPWVYAGLITLFAVIITVWLSRISFKLKKFELKALKKKLRRKKH